jgi:hypothetical protein
MQCEIVLYKKFCIRRLVAFSEGISDTFSGCECRLTAVADSNLTISTMIRFHDCKLSDILMF